MVYGVKFAGQAIGVAAPQQCVRLADGLKTRAAYVPCGHRPVRRQDAVNMWTVVPLPLLLVSRSSVSLAKSLRTKVSIFRLTH